MMAKRKSAALAFGAMCALAATLAFGTAPALAQTASSGADSYKAGVDLGRTLLDARQCTGSGDYRDGCVDGVQESQFDRQADQALDSTVSDAKPAEHPPLLSPPPDLFHDPFSKPGESGPPNN
jgi:hypothetical protein